MRLPPFRSVCHHIPSEWEYIFYALDDKLVRLVYGHVVTTLQPVLKKVPLWDQGVLVYLRLCSWKRASHFSPAQPPFIVAHDAQYMLDRAQAGNKAGQVKDMTSGNFCIQ